MVFLLGQVGYPNGDCQAGISAEYTSDGENLLMGTVGVKQFRGKCLNSNKFTVIVIGWRLLSPIIGHYVHTHVQHKQSEHTG